MIIRENELPTGGNIWVTADTHFGQSEVITFYDVDSGSKEPMRPFDTIEEMDECILDHWSECIRPGDTLWHLGDVVGPNQENLDWFIDEMHSVLNGVDATVLLGNHDNGMRLAKTGLFKNIEGDIDARAAYGFYATHEPVHIDTLYHWERTQAPSVNIHGHIHTFREIDDLWINLCVEMTDFAPVNFEDILMRINEVRENYDPDEYGPDIDPSMFQ